VQLGRGAQRRHLGSVDTVLEKIYRQIERYKGRHWRTRGDGRPISEVVAETGPLAEAPEEDPEAQIVRRKQFLLVPMTEPEAIEQMELLGHPEFFVFFNAETNGVSSSAA
jgi:putative sigma-54 modulation protein